MRDFDWQIILTLYETLNITRTAELLSISQPALTRRIQLMERELGVSLVRRGARGCVFTPEGELIARKAAAIVEAIQDIRRDTAAWSRGARGVLRLGVPYSFIRHTLPALLFSFSRQYPDVAVDIVTLRSDQLIQGVKERRLDVCFARCGTGTPTLERVLFSRDQIQVAAKHPFRIEDLAGMPRVEFTKNPETASAIRRWWDQRFSTPPDIRFTVPNGDACISMIRHGLGYGLFPDPRYIQDEPELYALPLCFLDGSPLSREMWMLFDQEHPLTAVTSNFIRFVRESLLL